MQSSTQSFQVFAMFFSKPLYLLSVLTGICVFSAKGKFSTLATLWAIVCLCTTSVISMHYRIHVARIHSFDFQMDIFSHALPTVSLFGKVLTCAIHLVVSIVRRREFENVFQVLKFRKFSMFHFLSVFTGFSMSAFIFTLHLTRVSKWPPYMDQLRLPHTVDSAGLVYFSALCYYINLQFCCLVENGRAKIVQVIKRLSKGDLFSETQHLKIIQTLEKANELYGIQTAVNCAQAFSYLLTHIYYLSTYEKFELFPEPEYKTALQMQALFSFFMFYELASSCETAASEVEEFNCELLKVLLINQDIRRNERLKLYVMVTPSIEFNACGFFYLGYSLVMSVITATATYVIVLVQFT